MTMLWNRCQCYEADDHVMTPMIMLWYRWSCYETDDNVVKPMILLCNRWSCYEADDGRPPPQFNHSVIQWQCYEADDNVVKPMTMLWNRWSCYETEDHAVIPKIMLWRWYLPGEPPVSWDKWRKGFSHVLQAQQNRERLLKLIGTDHFCNCTGDSTSAFLFFCYVYTV